LWDGVGDGPGDGLRALAVEGATLPDLLQAHFNVKTILMPDGRGTPVDIIGAPADIDFAIYAFNRRGNPRRGRWQQRHARREESYAADQRQAYGLVVVDQQAHEIENLRFSWIPLCQWMLRESFTEVS